MILQKPQHIVFTFVSIDFGSKNMSDENQFIAGDDSGHNESNGEDLNTTHAEMTSIHSDLTSTVERRDDGEEITAAALFVPPAQSAVRINVYENIPFAGGDGDFSILSVLFGPHSIGKGIFCFITMIDSNKVRVQCRECRQAIMDFPWMDSTSKIKGSIEKWRASFPVARAVNVSERKDIVDADFVHIRGDARARLHTVDMNRCKAVTDAAFVYLRGIHTLNMFGCNQMTITDAAFVHLRGIHTLSMGACNQETITDAAFVNLRGIHTLNMGVCYQETITDAAFVNLRGIHTLIMGSCRQITISDAAFVHLRGIHTLVMNNCNQATITDAAFVHLSGIKFLAMNHCYQATITDAAFVHLSGIRSLSMSRCNQATITDAAFVHLGGIKFLDIDGCNQANITGATFEHLRGIYRIQTTGCSPPVVQAAALLLAKPAGARTLIHL